MRPHHFLTDRSSVPKRSGTSPDLRRPHFCGQFQMDVAYKTSTCLFRARGRAREEWRSLHRCHRGTFECCENTKLRLCLVHRAWALSGSHRYGLQDHAGAAANGCSQCSDPPAGRRTPVDARTGAAGRRVACDELDGYEPSREFYERQSVTKTLAWQEPRP
jgi:hypothetical protein